MKTTLIRDNMKTVKAKALFYIPTSKNEANVKYDAKKVESTKNNDVTIWKIKDGYVMTKSYNTFSKIYTSVRSCKMTTLWKFHK